MIFKGIVLGNVAPSYPVILAYPVGLGIPFVIFKGIVLGDVAPSYPVILACRGQGCPWKYIMVVWIPFVRPRILLLPRREPWAWNGMG